MFDVERGELLPTPPHPIYIQKENWEELGLELEKRNSERFLTFNVFDIVFKETNLFQLCYRLLREGPLVYI